MKIKISKTVKRLFVVFSISLLIGFPILQNKVLSKHETKSTIKCNSFATYISKKKQ